MIRVRRSVASVLGVAVMLAGVLLGAGLLIAGLWAGSATAAADLRDDGIGPLRLGERFDRAETKALRLGPGGLYAGPGCSGLREIRYDIRFGAVPVGVMAMGEHDIIQQVEATLHAPTRAADAEACMALRDDFAEPLVQRFWSYERQWQTAKPVSTEFLARTGPVVVVARWFDTGGSCYVSARFEAAPE